MEQHARARLVRRNIRRDIRRDNAGHLFVGYLNEVNAKQQRNDFFGQSSATPVWLIVMAIVILTGVVFSPILLQIIQQV